MRGYTAHIYKECPKWQSTENTAMNSNYRPQNGSQSRAIPYAIHACGTSEKLPHLLCQPILIGRKMGGELRKMALLSVRQKRSIEVKCVCGFLLLHKFLKFWLSFPGQFEYMGSLNNCLTSEKIRLYNGINPDDFTKNRVIQRPHIYLLLQR